MQNKVVGVLGDFLIDMHQEYRELKKHYELVDSKSFDGGATATLRYVSKLEGFNGFENSLNVDYLSQMFLSDARNASLMLKRIRYSPWDYKFSILERLSDWETYIDQYHNNLCSAIQTFSPTDEVVLAISDYNKGALERLVSNPHWTNLISKKKITATIVDSRYRSVPDKLLAIADTTIWHATGQEYDENYGRKFDWTIHTNGPEAIRLLDASQNTVVITHVPAVKVVDATGAGDCFTAAIATYLTQSKVKEIDYLTICDAIQFAVLNCLEVVQTNYTAIPSLMIPITKWR
jgi:bifunctional ADP-heptose synthase (sugar kinase/adenylyltransferase)